MFKLQCVLTGGLSVCGMLFSGSSLTQAQTFSPTQLAESLQEAICLNDWESAIWATNQLIGHSDITPDGRQHFMNLRRQYQDYNSANAAFDFSGETTCQDMLTRQAQATETQPQTQPTSAPLDWSRATQNLSGRSSSSTTMRVTDSSTASASQAAMNCPEPPAGDREVASGSISSRWTYEIYQVGSSTSFYGRYWPQNDCEAIRQTSRHPTQSDVHDAMRWSIERAAF
ncbi:MAG: hypothetical protein AAFY26_19950 [Cyanobacteria bacterium J06638_22]